MAADQNHGRNANERAALNERKTRSKLPPAKGLQQGCQARGKQIGADQCNYLLGRELERAAENQRHRHRAGIHHQHMLQPEQEQLRKPLDLIDRVGAAMDADPGAPGCEGPRLPLGRLRLSLEVT